MTSPAHASGTDRVAEVAGLAEYASYPIVVNVQGDEPFVEAGHVTGAVTEVRRGRDVGTIATPLRNLAAWRDPAVVKVARRLDGAALYFTRSPIPHRRGSDPTPEMLSTALYLRHVGVYAYTRSALERWTALPPSALEMEERLEQLRPLAAGMTIGVAVVERAEPGVDTPADARRAARRLELEPSGGIGA
jgi:3-deoxy-manno-octulosonate cytidylyltransferase (CMP-KDO synthetase)